MRLAAMLALAAVPFVSACGVNPLNLSSLPIPASVDVRNEATHNWLRTSGPKPVASLGLKTPVRDALADGEVVGLTVSGGGMRASAFTLGVLEELERLKTQAGDENDGREEEPGEGSGEGSGEELGPNALDRVDFISSISGGSWAVAAFLANRADHPGTTIESRRGAILEGFAKTGDQKVRCWANSMIGSVTNQKTFAQVYSSRDGQRLPQVFFGSSLYPSQSPFVFTRDFLKHYKVRQLGDFCGPERVEITGHALDNVPIGYAASASGTVPGFTSAFGMTDLCKDARYSFCNLRKPRKSADYVQIVDGGVYDNLGYKTAFEHLLMLREAAHGTLPPATMIMINSGTDEPQQSVPRSKRNNSNPLAYAFASSFPNQDATFARLARLQFRAVGVAPKNTVLLDFDSLAGFDPEAFPNALDDLPELADYAARGVRCFAADRKKAHAPEALKRPAVVPSVEDSLDVLRSRGGDCLRMNFLRVGYLHKTTYKYDEYAFILRHQLGKLAVRMNAQKLIDALDRSAGAKRGGQDVVPTGDRVMQQGG